MYDCGVADATRVQRGPRSESREAVELRALRTAHPELVDAVDLQLEMVELYRRVQGRVPVPWIDSASSQVAERAAAGRPLVAFETVPVDLTDLRLLVRQTAEAMRRHGFLDEAEYARVQAVGRDMGLLVAVGAWYRAAAEQHGGDVSAPTSADEDPALAQVLTLAMRPFLSRCAEVVQQRPELAQWTRGYCAACGADPDFSVLTAGDRLLICSRCGLQWKFEPATCPFCRNEDRDRLSTFATADGKYQVQACEVCRRYIKAYDARRGGRPVMPLVDTVATLPLDAAAVQKGYVG